MIKCKGYYTEKEEEIDYEKFDRLGIPPPEPEIPEMIETTCYIQEKGIQAIFDTQDGKLVIYYNNGFDVLIKNEKKTLEKLISL